MTSLLIVDDAPFLEELLMEELTGEDIRITSIETAGSALEMIRADRFDIVLIDIYLQGSGGWDLLQQLKNEDPQLSVLIVSAYDNFVEDPRLSDADGYVIKERSAEKLIKKIEEMLIRKHEGRKAFKYARESDLEQLRTRIRKDNPKVAEQYSLKVANLNQPAAPSRRRKSGRDCRYRYMKAKKSWLCEHINAYEMTLPEKSSLLELSEKIKMHSNSWVMIS